MSRTRALRLVHLLPHGSFARAWREVARGGDFGDVNRVIDEHNRCYPIEDLIAGAA